MKLTYRGTSYDYNPPQVELKGTQLAGRYRGVDWRFANPAKHYVQQPSLDLVYRGVAYHTGATAPVQQPMQQPMQQPTGQPLAAPVVAASQLADRSRELLVKHQRDIKIRQQAMLTRLAADVGLATQDASHYWNRIQGKIHPSFRASYDRSRAAMS